MMHSDAITFKKSVPTVGHYDVAVCGGGPAGIAAAVANESKSPVGEIDISRLRRILTDNGVTV